jgi:hypothetical protein
MKERYSAAERAAILGQYKRSGLDLEIFAAWSGIGVSRLRRWMALEQPRAQPRMEWIEVEVSADEEGEAVRC